MLLDFSEVNPNKADLVNPIVLAYIGDAIYESYVRLHIVKDGAFKTNILHKKAIQFVSAKSQANILDLIQDELTETEKNIVRRGRNANANTIPKNATVAVYKKATAFEALIGYLFLSGQNDRMEQIVKIALTREETCLEEGN